MTERVVNFSAGPGTLPLPVLERARDELVAIPGVGASPLEVSHRGAWFTDVIERAQDDLRALLALPDAHHVLFCQGGASMQFSMVAMNLLRGRTAEHVVTGAWSRRAFAEAAKEGTPRVAWSGEADGFRTVPADGAVRVGPDAAYVHVTTNETIHGVQLPALPAFGGIPVVADASSDFLSRPVDLASVGLLYAGAQKNAGPAGVTVVVVREDMLELIPDGLPSTLDYRTYVEHGSMYNTPPVFSIYILGLVAAWLRHEIGGLAAMDARNRAKAALLYDAIDGSEGFYRGHAEPDARSLMNVTFRLPDEDLERAFLAGAAAEGLVELRGHRSVGGIRASIYNAMEPAGVEALAAFMTAFRDARG
jgi:phosphoserine aminotransferase